jgi:hypothetical protein
VLFTGTVQCEFGDCQPWHVINSLGFLLAYPPINGQVKKTFSQTFTSNSKAADAMKQVESSFSQFGNYSGTFGPAEK